MVNYSHSATALLAIVAATANAERPKKNPALRKDGQRNLYDLPSDHFTTESDVTCDKIIQGHPKICIIRCIETKSTWASDKLLDEDSKVTQRRCESGWEVDDGGDHLENGWKGDAWTGDVMHWQGDDHDDHTRVDSFSKDTWGPSDLCHSHSKKWSPASWSSSSETSLTSIDEWSPSSISHPSYRSYSSSSGSSSSSGKTGKSGGGGSKGGKSGGGSGKTGKSGGGSGKTGKSGGGARRLGSTWGSNWVAPAEETIIWVQGGGVNGWETDGREATSVSDPSSSSSSGYSTSGSGKTGKSGGGKTGKSGGSAGGSKGGKSGGGGSSGKTGKSGGGESYGSSYGSSKGGKSGGGGSKCGKSGGGGDDYNYNCSGSSSSSHSSSGHSSSGHSSPGHSHSRHSSSAYSSSSKDIIWRAASWSAAPTICDTLSPTIYPTTLPTTYPTETPTIAPTTCHHREWSFNPYTNACSNAFDNGSEQYYTLVKCCNDNFDDEYEQHTCKDDSYDICCEQDYSTFYYVKEEDKCSNDSEYSGDGYAEFDSRKNCCKTKFPYSTCKSEDICKPRPPTPEPTKYPTEIPTESPTEIPTTEPIKSLTEDPTVYPTATPTIAPTTCYQRKWQFNPSSKACSNAYDGSGYDTENDCCIANLKPNLGKIQTCKDHSIDICCEMDNSVFWYVEGDDKCSNDPIYSGGGYDKFYSKEACCKDKYSYSTCKVYDICYPSYTDEPTESPTEIPTKIPTKIPTESPTESPIDIPTDIPTTGPTDIPTDIPTTGPTDSPTTPSPTTCEEREFRFQDGKCTNAPEEASNDYAASSLPSNLVICCALNFPNETCEVVNICNPTVLSSPTLTPTFGTTPTVSKETTGPPTMKSERVGVE